MKRISLLLCLVLTITMTAGLPATAYAAEDDLAANLNAVKGAYITYGQDRNEMVYDEDVFRTESYEYNSHLATMSIDLCELASNAGRYSDSSERYLNQSRNLREYLEANGFSDFEANDDYKQESVEDTSCCACAHKLLKDGDKTYTLLVIVPRSGTYDAEWPQNFIISSSRDDKDDYAGYRTCCDKVEAFVKEYAGDKDISGDVKVWTSGYSRGAGIDNILGGDLIDKTEEILGSDVTLRPEDLYCYTFGTMSSAATAEGSADRYKGIHNVFENDDIAANIVPAAFGLSRYGQNRTFSEGADLDRMLELLKTESSSVYNRFQEGNPANPYEFSPYKLDTSALLNGELGFTEDDSSYLPDNLADYLKLESESIGVFSARSSKSGTDSRAGFYDYQTAACNLLTYTRREGNEGDLISGIISGDKAIPLMLSVYLTFVVDKAAADSNAVINDAIEGCFNTLAYIVEDENGGLKEDFCCIGKYYYNKFKSLLFTENTELTADETAAATIVDPPQKYKLRVNVHGTPLMLSLMKKITGRLYAEALEETLVNLGADDDTIAQLTDETDCENIAYALTYMALGNSGQSKGLPAFSLDNEQFKHLATFIGNMSRFATTHDIDAVVSWLRAADSYHDNYSRPDDAEFAGCRRVYIGQPEDVNVSGYVKDASGNVIAKFRNGELTCRSDEWIGITTSDSGRWLRLPVGKAYKVIFTVDKACTQSLSLDEYSIWQGDAVRTVNGDSTYADWTNLSMKAGSILTLIVPAVSADYSLPSDAEYSVSIEEPSSEKKEEDQRDTQEEAQDSQKEAASAGEEAAASQAAASQSVSYRTSAAAESLSGNIPSVKSVKAKASKKSLTLKWKAFNNKQRKKISRIEVQYSTDSSFSGTDTSTKAVSAKKTSVRIKKLTGGTKYYTRMRTVQIKNGTKYVSNWSAVRKVKVK